MTAWTVEIGPPRLSPGTTLDFYLPGTDENVSLPPLARGDTFVLKVPGNDDLNGVVFDVDDDKGVIEIDGTNWSFHRAREGEGWVTSPRGMKTVQWILGARIPK